jgi:hypothetical protein
MKKLQETKRNDSLLDIITYLKEWERMMAKDRKTPPAPKKNRCGHIPRMLLSQEKERWLLVAPVRARQIMPWQPSFSLNVGVTFTLFDPS